MTPSTDRADRTEKALSADPIENAEPIDPTDPIENAEPTDPIDMNELREPMHSTEFVDRRLRIDDPFGRTLSSTHCLTPLFPTGRSPRPSGLGPRRSIAATTVR